MDALGRVNGAGISYGNLLFFGEDWYLAPTGNDHSPLRLTFQARSMSFMSGTIKIKFGSLF